MLPTVNLIGLNWFRRNNYEHPIAAFLVISALVVWTAVAIWLYADPRRRVAVVLVADLAVAVGSLPATPLLKGDFRATVAEFWIAGALLAWALHWRLAGGLVAALVLSTADLGLRATVTQANCKHVFLLLLAGVVVGYIGGRTAAAGRGARPCRTGGGAGGGAEPAGTRRP